MVSRLEFGRGSKLWKYWTRGKGLARWAESPTPFRTLRIELAKEGVPETMLDGLTANIYHEVFKRWPGRHDGGDHGNTPGDKVVGRS